MQSPDWLSKFASSCLILWFVTGDTWRRYWEHSLELKLTQTFLPALQKQQKDINQRAADMWSYAVMLWELATREVPFADMSPMETGMKVHRCSL